MICLPLVGKGGGSRPHGRHRILAGAFCGLSPQRQAASPALVPLARQDTVPPSRPPLGECALRFNQVAAAAPCWQRWASQCPQRPAPCRRFLFSRSSCFPNRRGNDALRGRLRLQVIPRARAAAGWNRGQVEPFRLRTRLAGKRKPRPSTTIPLDPASPGGKKALSVLAKAKPVFHGSGSALWFCLGYSLPYWLPGLIGLGLGLNPIECRTQPYWVGD